MPYRDITVGALLTRLADDLPGREALVYSHAGERWTFRALDDEARLIARGLVASGVGPGDRVAVWATNVPEWIVLQFALAKIGAILVTVNTALRAQEIAYLLRQSDTSTLVTIRGFRGVDYVDELRAAGAIGDADRRARDFPKLARTIFIGPDAPPRSDALRRAARHRGGGAGRATCATLEAAVDVDDVINMQYTSGTTGFPKGVMLSSRNIVNNGHALGQGLGFTTADRLCLCVPLFHCFGCVIGVLGAFSHGACLCPVESFDPRRVLETVVARALHGALRRADDVSRGARRPRVRPLRPELAPDRHHGRRALSRAAHAQGDRPDAPAGDDHLLRADRNLARADADAARREPRGAARRRSAR